jgi:hypothetical protein
MYWLSLAFLPLLLSQPNRRVFEALPSTLYLVQLAEFSHGESCCPSNIKAWKPYPLAVRAKLLSYSSSNSKLVLFCVIFVNCCFFEVVVLFLVSLFLPR